LAVVGGSQRTSSVDHSVESFLFVCSRCTVDRPGAPPTGAQAIAAIDAARPTWGERLSDLEDPTGPTGGEWCMDGCCFSAGSAARWANHTNAGKKADSAARRANRANAGKTAGSVARRANRANTGKKHPPDDHNTTRWN